MKNLARLLGIVSDKTEESVANQTAAAVMEVVQPETDNQQQEERRDVQEVRQIDVGSIIPNPFQPRKTFHDEGLQELSSSIQEFGVIQPLLVRAVSAEQYELIAGERRLRASKLAGLTEVPVIVKELNDKEMAELALIENLQREDLHFLEEALGFQQLLANFGLTQEELARRVGKNQSTIANKLRILRLAPEVQAVLVSDNLTERHARSLLKLEDTQRQLDILNVVRENHLNVKATEDLVEDVLEGIQKEQAKKAPKQNVVRLIRDLRIYINTINSVVTEMKKAGFNVRVQQTQDDDYVTVNLRIPKRKS